MSQAIEDTNRRLLRARDAMDLTYGRPLDIATLAARRLRVRGALHPRVSRRPSARRRIATCSAGASNERSILLRCTDRSVTDICLDVGFTSLGTFSKTFHAIVGEITDASTGSEARRRRSNVFRDGLDETEQFWRRRPTDRTDSVRTAVTAFRQGNPSHMLSSLRISQIYVLDQDQAVDFYVGKLGLEINTDQDLGFMRFLTVSVPGDPERQIMLEKPGPPAMDPATADEVRSLLTKGRTGGHLFFTTADARKTYDELRAKDVEFTQEPTEQPYGIDFGLRDPFGNHIRVAQMASQQ